MESGSFEADSFGKYLLFGGFVRNPRSEGKEGHFGRVTVGLRTDIMTLHRDRDQYNVSGRRMNV